MNTKFVQFFLFHHFFAIILFQKPFFSKILKKIHELIRFHPIIHQKRKKSLMNQDVIATLVEEKRLKIHGQFFLYLIGTCISEVLKKTADQYKVWFLRYFDLKKHSFPRKDTSYKLRDAGSVTKFIISKFICNKVYKLHSLYVT
jgi:hypothetical protein